MLSHRVLYPEMLSDTVLVSGLSESRAHPASQILRTACLWEDHDGYTSVPKYRYSGMPSDT